MFNLIKKLHREKEKIHETKHFFFKKKRKPDKIVSRQ